MATYDFIKTDWFAKRLNALIVPFPRQLTADMLSDKIYGYNPGEVLSSLKSTHIFLSDILAELIYSDEAERYQIIDTYNLIWMIGAVGELEYIQNRHCIRVDKKTLSNTNMKYKPKSLQKSLNALKDLGVEIEYYDNDVLCIKQDFKTCNTVKLVFDNNIALGLRVFVRCVMEKQWYSEFDKVGNYSKVLDYSPIKHTIEPYHRVDMRMFLSDSRIDYDIIEQTAGYDIKTIALFKTINDYMAENYAKFAPNKGFYRYLFCTVSYLSNYTKRHLGAIGLGYEDSIGFYTSLKGKELEMAYAEIENYSELVVNRLLYNNENNDPSWVKKIDRVVIYKGQKYNCSYTSLEIRFPIIDEKTANDAIRLMSIKADCNQGIKQRIFIDSALRA